MRGKSIRYVVSAALAAVVALGVGPLPGRAVAEEAASGSGVILVSAAVSLKAALDDAKAAFESKNPAIQVTLNTGASGVLLAQIEHGAPVDLFVSASPDEIDRLAAAGKILAETRTDLASNRLVIALGAGEKPLAEFGHLVQARFQRIAIGNPKTVPAGRYAKESFVKLGLWPRLAPRLILADNVRQVLDYVARGEVDAGLVYRSDIALLPGKVVEGPEAPVGSHSTIRYQGVVPSEAPHPDPARRFLEYLSSPDGQRTLASHGFLPPAGSR